MSLPLQPTGQPWPPGLRRAALVLLLAIAVLLLGLVAPARVRPPQLILGGPDRELDYAREARRLIDGAQRRLWMSMYVLRPDDGIIGGLLDGLAAAAARGVDVRVVLDRGAGWDGQPDLKHEAPAAWLAAHGVRTVLDEDEVTSHAKVLVADSRLVLSGSHNWTRSALMKNRELSWLVDDAEAAAAVERWLAAIPGW
jgi:phosphatidylserine/phosphatidylglycerophosphate/cardiolipin synthase-like enzyme